MEAARRRSLTLAATALGSALGFIDATIVVVALPAIDRDVGLGLDGQQWVFLAYSLTLAALFLVSGGVGDRYGRRTTFVGGVVAFAVASALCALAPNEATLIAARALQGVGGAVMTTNSLALLREVYREESGRAIGLWTSFTSIATVIGPPAGGAVVDHLSWRWIFGINLPLAVVVVVLARAGRGDERATERVGRLDLVGSALAGIGFAALTFALVEGAERGFGEVWWAAVLAAAALGGLVAWEARAPAPLVPLELFRSHNVVAANATTFLAYAALGAAILYLPLYAQFLGYSASVAGLVFVPVSVALALLATTFGALADRRGPRLFLALGPALIGVGLVLLALVGDRGDVPTTGLPGLLVFSLGIAIMVAPITAAAIAGAPERLAGVASGVNQTVARVGGLVAVALVGLVITLVFGDAAGEPLRAGQAGAARNASADAFRAGMLAAAALAFGAAVVGGVWVSDARDRVAAEPEPPAGGPAPTPPA